MHASAQLATSPALAPAPESGPRSFLWVTINLHSLALTSLGIDKNDHAVVIEPSRHGAVVYRSTTSARAAGIVPGIGINAALAICGELVTYPRSTQAERQQLEKIHRWANRFTPTVCLLPPTALTFEIMPSLKLFGGIKNLCGLIRDGLRESGHDYHLAVAPTPAASSIFAHAGREIIVVEKAELRSHLAEFSIRSLDVSEPVVIKLRTMGVTRLKELWRLPRPDLARRFGPALLQKVDQLLGFYPDPREPDPLAPRFDRYYELEVETNQADVVLQAVRFLLQELIGYLKYVDADAGEVLVLLSHCNQSTTSMKVGTRLPTRNIKQWSRLLQEHVERQGLVAPVTGVRMVSRDFQLSNRVTMDFFESSDPVQDWKSILDELEAVGCRLPVAARGVC